MTGPDCDALRLPPVVHALGFSAWKRPIVRRFLGESSVRFVDSTQAVPDGATLVVWAARMAALLPAGLASARGWQVVTLEDGFLRSVGLGAGLEQPLSWVLDREGCHFDASRPSVLETMLNEATFGPALCTRAAALRQAVVQLGLTKYNVGTLDWQPPAAWQAARRRAGSVLVVGQVESDASLRLGSPVVRSNLHLLQAARRLHPEAHLVYKPHPDVTAGLREAGSDEHLALQLCDAVVDEGVSMSALLGHVDAVHVMTSLAGFEALLRHVPVTVHGLPFYAGWGLTQDQLQAPRRRRVLSLDALVAGALIAYPRYAAPDTGQRLSAEQAVQWLAERQARSLNTRWPWSTRWRPGLVRSALAVQRWRQRLAARLGGSAAAR